jgi:hypothetical protein
MGLLLLNYRGARCGFAVSKTYHASVSSCKGFPLDLLKKRYKTAMAERKKGGRPSLGETKKTEEVTVFFSKREYEILTRKAAAVNLSLQDYLRELVVKGYVKNIDTPEQQEVKRQLIGLSNNVNQLAKLAHINGMKTMQKQVDEILDSIDELLKKYKK